MPPIPFAPQDYESCPTPPPEVTLKIEPSERLQIHRLRHQVHTEHPEQEKFEEALDLSEKNRRIIAEQFGIEPIHHSGFGVVIIGKGKPSCIGPISSVARIPISLQHIDPVDHIHDGPCFREDDTDTWYSIRYPTAVSTEIPGTVLRLHTIPVDFDETHLGQRMTAYDEYPVDEERTPVVNHSTLFYPGKVVKEREGSVIMKYPVRSPHPLNLGRENEYFNSNPYDNNLQIALMVLSIDPRSFSDMIIYELWNREGLEEAHKRYQRMLIRYLWGQLHDDKINMRKKMRGLPSWITPQATDTA